MSEEHKKYLKNIKTTKKVVLVLQIVLLILFIGLWELIAYFEWIDPFIISSPSRILQTFINLINKGQLLPHLTQTLVETIISFLLSTILGTIFAIILWWNSLIKKVLEPYIIVLNALPKIALGPLIIIWVGMGAEAIIVMSLLISVIITIISMLSGFMEVDNGKIQLLKTMGANKIQIFTKLIFPANIPTLIGVLKINVGLSWVGTIMGEYLVSSKGIGYLLVYGSQIFNLDLVMTSTILLCILATIMYLIVSILEKIILKRLYK